jgi:hypothetical protein
VFASVLPLAALVVLTAAGLTLIVAIRLRTKVRRASWLLTRVAAAIGEAERAGRVRAELADTRE